LIFFLILSLQPLKLGLSVAETIPYFAIKEAHGKGMKQGCILMHGWGRLRAREHAQVVESSLSLGYRFVGFNG
jgi:hypothetical protein